MRILVTGIYSRHPGQRKSARDQQTGYTLVEIIVVLLIISIAVSLVIPRLNLRDTDADISYQSKYITTLVRSIKQESAMRGTIMGIDIDKHAVKVVRLKDGAWSEVQQAGLASHSLPDMFTLDLQAHQSPLNTGNEGNMPLLFLPDGQASQFELVLSNLDTQEKLLIQNTYSGLQVHEH